MHRDIQWPADMIASEEQIRLIKARNWLGYIFSFHNPPRVALVIFLRNVDVAHAEDRCMARIEAQSTGHVQVNVSDFLYLRNYRHPTATPENGYAGWTTKDRSRGIRRVFNKRLRLCINID